MTHESGQILLHYRLVEQVGQGGMGTVWLARDTTLERDAAIKLLPDGLTSDSEFLARFDREAKLLASLNHPNIAGVFGVHDANGTRFLAMEFVPGEDLSQRLRRSPLSVDELVSIMGQVADGLEAAHKKGVIHRDLKPANVRLTPEGRVKVLDFGLAKSVEPDAANDSASDPPLTATGVVLGTAPYMSPEQIRGQPVDSRSDLWSFGCMTWECLTGRRPFVGASLPEQLAAVLNEEPDWDSLPPDTPTSLQRLLRRCLAKPVSDRLHHAADARIELEDARRELGGDTSRVSGAAPVPAKASPVRLVALAAAAIAIGVIVTLLLRSDDLAAPRPPVLATARFETLTNFPGNELGAAISPDGNSVAFLSDQSGTFHAYVGGIGDAFRDVSESSGAGEISWPMIRVRRIGFFGDGKALWLGGGPNHKAKRVPLVGTGITPWLQKGLIHMDWSPDGKRMVYSHSTNGDPVFVANADGTEAREVPLPTPDGYHQHFPTWSIDGEWLYIARGIIRSDRMDLWRVRPDGSELKQLTKGLRNVMYPAPLDERTVLFIAHEADGSGPYIWELDVETLDVRHALSSLARYTSISASRDGKRFVATVVNPEANLWTFPILKDRVAGEKDVAKHTLPAIRAHAPRIRGDALYYLSSRGGGDGLWVYKDGESREIWKGSEAALAEPAAISPDGEHIALNVREDGRGRLVVIKADGTDRRALMADVDIVGAACWSPDGEWIAVGGEQGGKRGLFKVRLDDGQVMRLETVGAMNPVWCPRNTMIVFEGPHVRVHSRVMAVKPGGGRVESFPTTVGVRPFSERLQFLPDGSGLVYMTGVNPRLEFRLLDLKSGESRSLARLDDAVMHTFDITPDGKTIVFDRERLNSDVVLITR